MHVYVPTVLVTLESELCPKRKKNAFYLPPLHFAPSGGHVTQGVYRWRHKRRALEALLLVHTDDPRRPIAAAAAGAAA